MNIEAERFKIEMTHNELWSTAFDVRYYLLNTVKTHWVNHQQSWRKNEEERLYRLKTMFNHLGRPEMHEGLEAEVNKIFEDINKTKK